jgi:hypothetical protein
MIKKALQPGGMATGQAAMMNYPQERAKVNSGNPCFFWEHLRGQNICGVQINFLVNIKIIIAFFPFPGLHLNSS